MSIIIIMLSFVRREIVFVIAFLAAFITAFFNPPSESWIEAVDFRTLALLFSLMGISEGLKASGLFDSAAGVMMKRAGNTRMLAVFLLAIVFVSSMFFTNDVALLMFVPFTMMILDREGKDEGYVIKLVVLETIAANLGSMTTPIGNPQNLYILSYFSVEAIPFFRTILPYSLASVFLIAVSFIILLRNKSLLNTDEREVRKADRVRTAIYLLFLAAALLTVFRVISFQMLFAAELLFLLIFDRKILRRIDYILLLTFVCFFIFSENMRNIESIRNLISAPMLSHPIASSAIVSQVISNVPAAILLSPFADGFEGVLIGTDIGGLGTPIASLASLISLKFYFRREGGRKGYYLAVFTVLNVLMLLILALLSALIE